MTSNLKSVLFTLLFSVITFTSVNSQIAISNIEELPKIKSGTTYVAMKDPNSAKSKEFVEVFKNTWTYSKIEFIKYSDIEKHLAAGNSFITIGGYVTDVHMSTLYSNGSRSAGVDYSHTHIYLELWNCSEKYLNSTKKNKAFKSKDKNQIARFELFTDFPTLIDPDLLYQNDYDGAGHIRNWGPGMLKNYLQTMTFYLNKNEERKLYDGISNPSELRKLKTETLLMPDYVLTKFNKFTGDESKKHEEKELFEDYKLSYKIVPTSDLNAKIMNDKNAFYYLQYVKSSTDKFVSVINSVTGEIVYSAYSPVSYNLKSDDLEDLQKKIQKI